MISNFKRTLFLILISSVLLSCGNENTTEVSNNDITMDTNVGISLGIGNMLLGIINGDSLIITAKPIIEKTDTTTIGKGNEKDAKIKVKDEN